MKFEEALVAMRQGKKIFNSNSPNLILYISKYYHKTYDNKNILITKNGEKIKTIFIREPSLMHVERIREADIPMTSIVMDEWEIVDEIY